MPKRTEVPANFVAFHYQALRFFSRLLDSEEGDCVYLEHYDDVAQKKKNNILVREQDKFYTSQNPASDWASPFWHTLANWLQILTSNTTNDKHLKFVYCCSCKMPAGEIIKQYHNAHSADEIADAIEYTKQKLNAASLKHENKKAILDIINSEKFPQLVATFEFILEDGQVNDIISSTLHRWIPIPSQADQCQQQLLGWILNKVVEEYHNGRIMCISHKEFMQEYKRIWNLLRADPLSVYASNYVLSDEEKKRLKNNTFIRQLQLVNLGKEEEEEAILDYIRTQNMSAKMANEGVLHSTGYKQFEEDIKARWKDIRENILDEDPHAEKERSGRRIFHQTMQLETNMKLQNQTPPSRFLRGTCHDLSDKLDIGWHPDFLLEIKKDD